MRPNSIRARMTRGFALYTAALMLLVCAAYVLYTARSERRKADATLMEAAQELRRELQSGAQSIDNPARLLDEEKSELHAADLAVVIVDRQGRVMAQSQQQVPPWPRHDGNWRVQSLPAGSRIIVIGTRWDKVDRELRERAFLLLGLSALVVAASAAGAWVLVGRTLSPIDHLARQAQAASTESLRVRLAAHSPDAEITRLVATLNDLLTRLETTAAARGRFYAAASHELRTPLQALTGHLEVALSRQRSAVDYQAALCEGHAQAERLSSLVQDLLLLNQLDAHTAHPVGVLLDLADICESELAHLRLPAHERGLKVELSLPATSEITAPWNHATMLIRNLLENSIKYATPGSTVQVQLRENTLTVCNDCAPLADWENDKHFEPFFRPDAARNSHTGGNGLGLAICKAICEANGWTISLRQKNGQVQARTVFREES